MHNLDADQLRFAIQIILRTEPEGPRQDSIVAVFWLIVYNQAIVYTCLNFFNEVVHVVIIDHWNSTMLVQNPGNGYL